MPHSPWGSSSHWWLQVMASKSFSPSVLCCSYVNPLYPIGPSPLLRPWVLRWLALMLNPAPCLAHINPCSLWLFVHCVLWKSSWIKLPVELHTKAASLPSALPQRADFTEGLVITQQQQQTCAFVTSYVPVPLGCPSKDTSTGRLQHSAHHCPPRLFSN